MGLIEVIIGAITVILNTYLGFLVYFKGKKSWTDRLFFFLTLVLSSYVIVNYLSLHPPRNTPEDQLFWIRVVMAVFSFLGPTLFLLIHTFPKENITIGKKYLVIISLILAAAVSASLSPYVFTHMEYPNGQPVPVPGPAIPIIFLDFAGLFVLSFILLIYKYIKSEGREKVQYSFFLMGITSTFTLMILSTFISVVVFKYSGLVFMGPTFALLLVGFITYAIVKHRFLDIRLVVARAVSFTLLIGILGLLSAFLFAVLSSLFVTSTLEPRTITISTVLALFMAATFQSFRRFIEKITDKIFYKDRYNTRNLLYGMALIMASTLKLEDLTHQMLKELITKMKITRGAFILKEEDVIYNVAQEGFTTTPDFDEQKVLSLHNHHPLLV
ncbi:hypothetical protein HY407_01260, partial [Candidatus Gottesmanbacteria bacterium]|nr:hypothetical protein [Candidatus Gottesmanbacteria bacterium]